MCVCVCVCANDYVFRYFLFNIFFLIKQMSQKISKIYVNNPSSVLILFHCNKKS